MYKQYDKLTDENIRQAIDNTKSMSAAAKVLGVALNTLKRHALRLDCYKPNQSGIGITKNFSDKPESKKLVYNLSDILNGKYPQYQSRKLRIRLIEKGIFEDKCCKCGWSQKRQGDKYSTCELHHVDGNHHNHLLDNLEILCPNCHSLTSNFRNVKRE